MADFDWANVNETTRYLSIEDLAETGLLWLINRVVFHPRGYRLGIEDLDSQHPFFLTAETGDEPAWFEPETDIAKYRAVEQTLRDLRREP